MHIVIRAYTDDDIAEMLKERLAGRQQRDLALEMGISQQYLNDILRRRRTAGPAILSYLGLEKAYVHVS